MLEDIAIFQSVLGIFTEVRFASFLSSGFTTMAVIIPPERKLTKRSSVQCRVNMKAPSSEMI